MGPVLVAGAVVLFVLAVAVAFIAGLAGVGGDSGKPTHEGSIELQKTVAVVGLLPALALIIAVAAGRRRFALIALVAVVITYVAWVVLVLVGGHAG